MTDAYSWKKGITYVCPQCGSAYDHTEAGEYYCEVCGTALKTEDTEA